MTWKLRSELGEGYEPLEPGKEYTVGRGSEHSPDIEIPFEDSCHELFYGSTSRTHAQLRAEEDACYLTDLDSKNGTYLLRKGEPEENAEEVIGEEKVGDGDQICFGTYLTILERID